MLASRLGAPPDVSAMFADFTARWDGKGSSGAKGEELPVALRVAHVARDASFQSLLRGSEGAVAVIRERSGGAFDPDVVAVLTGEMLSPVSAPGAHDELLASEPKPWLMLRGSGVDQALGGIGDFADLVSSYFTGHSAAVADLSGRAAALLGLSTEDVVAVGRAGRVHDIGRVAVETHAWNRSEALTVDQWERMRMHAHYTERVLASSAFLSRLGAIASAHHERIDGTGYHRGVDGPSLGQGGPGARGGRRIPYRVRAPGASRGPGSGASVGATCRARGRGTSRHGRRRPPCSRLPARPRRASRGPPG